MGRGPEEPGGLGGVRDSLQGGNSCRGARGVARGVKFPANFSAEAWRGRSQVEDGADLWSADRKRLF